MASCILFADNIICICGNKIKVFHIGAEESQLLNESHLGTESADDTKRVSSKGSSKGSKEADSNDAADGQGVLACCRSRSGRYFATCDDYKWLTVWCWEAGTEEADNSISGGKWVLLNKRQVVHRCTSLTFTQDEKEIVVADRSGDAYAFSVETPGDNRRLLLGHVSMLLDVVMTGDDEFVITSDRDEKIRVSCYPNSYNIHAYCLGHTDFVSSLCYLEDCDRLLSGSGDGTIRAWDYRSGHALSVTHCGHSEDGSPLSIRKLVYCKLNRIVAASFYRWNRVMFYSLLTENETALSTMPIDHVDLTADAVTDLKFDSEGRIWLLTTGSDITVHVYSYVEKTKKFQSLSAEGAENDSLSQRILTTLNVINSQSDFVTANTNEDFLYSVLTRKGKIDNMKTYMERKQQRIDGKRKIGETPAGTEMNQSETDDIKRHKTDDVTCE